MDAGQPPHVDGDRQGPGAPNGAGGIDTRQAEEVQGLPAQMANLTLSPDGRDLAYHAANDTGGMTAWHVPASGGDACPTVAAAAVRRLPSVVARRPPARTRSGRRRAHPDLGINRDGTGFRQVTTSSGQHWPHSWAPDNDRIAFAGERDGVWNVWTVSTATGRRSNSRVSRRRTITSDIPRGLRRTTASCSSTRP